VDQAQRDDRWRIRGRRAMTLAVRKLDVPDLRALEHLVTEHLEAVERGLTPIGTRLLLGHSVADLIAVDSRRTLVLGALGFTGDDAMLLRLIDAYAWCLEYPDTLGQLFPEARLRREAPPRVLVVAERLPDAFLRKIDLLRVPQADCFEFRHVEVDGTAGFYLEAVRASGRDDRPGMEPPADRPGRERVEPEPLPVAVDPGGRRAVVATRHAAVPARAAVEVGEPAPIRVTDSARGRRLAGAEANGSALNGVIASADPETAPEATAESGEAATLATATAVASLPVEEAPDPTAAAGAGDVVTIAPEERQALLKGLQLPRGAELAPQWRRLLMRAAAGAAAGGAIDEAKLRAVRDYLQRELPHCSVYDFHDAERNAQAYHLQNSHGRLSHLVLVTVDFLEARSEREIRRYLEQHKLSHTLRQAGTSDVVVSGAGIKIHGR
jgi:hypothetical protein